MINELTFRPMTLDDVDAVMHLENQVYQFPWTDTIFRDCLRVGYCCWIVECDDEIFEDIEMEQYDLILHQ